MSTLNNKEIDTIVKMIVDELGSFGLPEKVVSAIEDLEFPLEYMVTKKKGAKSLHTLEDVSEVLAFINNILEGVFDKRDDITSRRTWRTDLTLIKEEFKVRYVNPDMFRLTAEGFVESCYTLYATKLGMDKASRAGFIKRMHAEGVSDLAWTSIAPFLRAIIDSSDGSDN